MHALIFGFGYVGAAFSRKLLTNGWKVSATARQSADKNAAEAIGVAPIDPGDSAGVAAAADADAILITAAPDDRGCPGLEALSGPLTTSHPPAQWIGYLSSTSVYGDRAGAWTDENCALAATSPQGMRRAAAERAWFDFGTTTGLPVIAFRLSGIYGPGRSPFDRLRQGVARRIVKPGHITSRIHVEDIVAALEASLRQPHAGSVYNLSDDEPAPSPEVTRYAADLLGVEPPPIEVFDANNVAPTARRFFAESRRITNSRARRELGWSPAYPSYREGLAAILAAQVPGGR